MGSSAGGPGRAVKMEFSREAGYVRIQLEGELKFDTIRDAMVELTAQPEYDPSHHRIWDARGATLRNAPTTDVVRLEELTRGLPSAARGTKLAIVVSSDVDFGLGRLFQNRTSESLPASMQVFRDLDDAIGWVTSFPVDSD